MQHDEGQFQGSGGMRLYYQCWRPETAPARAAIILLHGDFAHSGWYMNLPTHEVPRGYAVYAYDRRGWGRSPGQRGYVHTWGENLDDLDAFMQRVRAEEPGRPIFLMGHTGSGYIVLEYALRHPDIVHGVFCVSPTLNTSGVISPVVRLLIHALARVLPRLTIDTRRQFDASSVYVSHDAAFVHLILTDPLRNSKVTPRWLVEAESGMQHVVDQAASFPVPLLILIGGADRISATGGSKAFFERVVLADKELHEYPGAYPNLLSDSVTEAVLRDIDTWLDRHVS